MSLESVQKAKISSLFWQGFFRSKKGVWGNSPNSLRMPGGGWCRLGFGRDFLRSAGLPNGQSLWKNRARRRVTIDAAGPVETSRRKNPGYWSMPDPEKVQHRASYGLFFRPIGEKSPIAHRGRGLRPLRGKFGLC